MGAEVVLSIASCTVEELAAYFRRGFRFVELAIVFVEPDERIIAHNQRCITAIHQGHDMVWSLIPEEHFITVHRARTHLEVFNAGDWMIVPELPNFACQTTDFFKYLGFTNPPST